MAAEFPAHPFWDFSLGVYGSEGVPAACLVLQERYQIDVNVFLFCCWIGASGRGPLDDGEIAAACEAVDAWHRDVVRAVRGVRQRLKGGFGGAPIDLSEPLRRRIGKTEVDLEHIEQLMLANSVDRVTDERRDEAARLGDALDNVHGYFGAFGITPDAADAAEAAVIFAPAFAGIDPATVGEAVHARFVP